MTSRPPSSHHVTPTPVLHSHETATQVLHRAGYSDDFIHEVLSQLPDPIDLQRDEPILARYGISTGRLMERMGGSP